MNLDDVRIAEEFDCLFDCGRGQHIIRIEKENYISLAQATRCVIGRPSAFIPFSENRNDARTVACNDVAGIVAGGVVHYDDFRVSVCLAQRAVNAVVQEPSIVVTADDNAYTGRVVHTAISLRFPLQSFVSLAF